MKLKESKGMSLIVFTVVLAVLVVLAVGVIVYLLNNPVKEKVAIQNPTGAQSNLGRIETNVQNTKEPVTNNETKVEIVKEKMTADERYKIFADNLKKEVSKYGDTANIQGAVADDIGYEVRLKSNGDLSLRLWDEELNRKYGTESLAKNVIAFSIIDVGQDSDWHCIYFINADGTVGYASMDSVIYEGKGEIKIENKIAGLKNIVAILSGGVDLNTSGALTPLFVDIDGNLFTEN